MTIDSTQASGPPDAAFLQHLADLLGPTDDDESGCAIVSVTPSADGFDFGTFPLDGVAPADALLGGVPPEDCWALGVAGRGWTRRLGADGVSCGERLDRAGMVVLVDREGHVASRLDAGGERITEAPAYGATLDCLQRAFALPTAPPTQPTGLAFAQQWLGNVCAAGERTDARLTWQQIADLHPARQLAVLDEQLAAVDFVEVAGALGRAVDWELFRWMAVEGKVPGRGLSGADAAWLDAGSFSRWILGQYPSLPELLDRISRVCGVATARRCARALRQVGLLTRGAWRPPGDHTWR